MASALSHEVQWMRRRVRHIHIPDLPPVFAPRNFAPTIRDHIQAQITRQRALPEQEPPGAEPQHGFAKPASRVQTSFTDWVKRAGPPPTVLSFTHRPTYILPKHLVERQEPWQIEYLTRALKSRMDVHFPEPPNWSSRPWRPFWEHDLNQPEWKHDPLNHQWPEVGVIVMPCAEARFLGPGQVSIWPIIDLKDEVQRGSARLTTKYHFERLLEDTTTELLKRAFHIEAFAIPGSTGVWVESRIPPAEVDVERREGGGFGSSLQRVNLRRIATIHTSITEDITQWGVSIHVGQPDPSVDSWARSTNPWIPIRQHHTTTSIAAELAYMKTTVSPLGPCKYLRTHFDQKAMPLRAGQGHIPYSRIKAESGMSCPAPLGMDNRDISSAWTYEFARQLGMRDGYVDHYSMVDPDELNMTNLPAKTQRPGFKMRNVFEEDEMSSPYRQVDVPSIQVGRNETVREGIVASTLRIEHHDGRIDSSTHDGWLRSWPLWQSTLTSKLDDAICGGPCDTRLKAYGLQKQFSSRLQLRRNELQQARQVDEEWRREMPELIRRPLKAGVIQELTERAREMEAILKTVRLGRKSQQVLDSTIQIRRFLERSFAGAVGGPVPLRADGADGRPSYVDGEAVSDDGSSAVRVGTSAFPTRQSRAGEGEPVDPTDQKAREPTRRLEDRVTPPRQPEQIVGFTETSPQKRWRDLGKQLEKANKRLQHDTPLLPRQQIVEFTKTRAARRQEQADERREKAEKRRDDERLHREQGISWYRRSQSSGAASASGLSEYLPKSSQIGGGVMNS
jgi:hypothetical protein